MAFQPIENYGIIGYLNTIALVGLDGSIDFMCFPDFDSPSIFAAFLDDKRGGYFQISSVFSEMNTKQLYLPDTNVLLTRFLILLGSVNAGIKHYKMAVNYLYQSHEYWPGLIEKVITNRFSYNDYDNALYSHKKDEIKAVVRWT